MPDDAVAMLENLSSVVVISLVDATYNRDILETFVEESETLFFLEK